MTPEPAVHPETPPKQRFGPGQLNKSTQYHNIRFVYNASAITAGRVVGLAALPLALAGAVVHSFALWLAAMAVCVHVYISVNILVYERRRIRRAIVTDPLTRLGNKRAFKRVRSAVDENPAESWIALDADSFKLLNDQAGEDEGDLALIFLSNAIRHALIVHGVPLRVPGRGLRAFRHGGDEYSVRVRRDQAQQILRTIERMSVYSIAGVTTRFTGAVGTTYKAASDTVHALKEQRRQIDPRLRRGYIASPAWRSSPEARQ